jgi:hypothetical protein
MSSENQEYSVDQEIINFFQETSTDHPSCDDRAQKLVGGTVTPVMVQGVFAVTLYTQVQIMTLWSNSDSSLLV